MGVSEDGRGPQTVFDVIVEVHNEERATDSVCYKIRVKLKKSSCQTLHTSRGAHETFQEQSNKRTLLMFLGHVK